MQTKHYLHTSVALIVSLLIPLTTQAITIEISATVPGCGDGVVSGSEQCDGSNLGGATCSVLGFTGGSLSCSSACTFITSSCTSGSSGGGGGGGGGGNSTPSIPSTNVVFTGRAYPKSTITLLKDAQVVATTIADATANFQVTISNISGGNYIFSVYSEDSKGIRSPLLTFPVGVTAGVTTKVSGIFIAPSILVDKSEVKKGDTVAIFGQSAPSSEVTISVNSEEEFFIKRMTDKNGVYLLNFDTSVLEMGQHSTKSRSAVNGEISSFSKVVGFIVGHKNVLALPPVGATGGGDLNQDGRLNIIDFSIMAFWYKRPNPPIAADLNGDGKVDLVDLSILAFNWTG